VTHVPSDPLGVGVSQPAGDLLRAPLQLELVLHQVTELGVGGEPPGPDPGTALLGPSMGQVAVVAAAIMLGRAVPRRNSRLTVEADRPTKVPICRTLSPRARNDAIRCRSNRDKYRDECICSLSRCGAK
jgi:hypothetical protein